MMEKGKKLYVVPGFKETTKYANYEEIIEYAEKHNFEIVPISIDWIHDQDMDEYISEVEKQLPYQSSDYILGFSFGAYITYLLSRQKKFSAYIFCTISPYFKEKIKKIPTDAKRYFGPRFMESVAKNSLHDGNDSPAWFLTGQKDWPLAIETNQEAQNKWIGPSDFILVKDAAHELAHENYVEEVKWILKELDRQ